MIYLVSNTIDVSGIDGVEKISINDSLDLIQSWPVVQFDTETTGLDPHICSLYSLQFGYKDFSTGNSTQIVVDCKSIKPEKYKGTIEGSYLIGHNLKFDLEFLYNHSITPLTLWDTMICEQTLHLGYKPGKVPMNLGAVLLRHTGIELDKQFQSQIAQKGLTKEGIIYAANDVVYLQDIRKSQLEIAKSRECTKALIVENQFVPAIAYLEWCGVHLDVNKWKEKMSKDENTLSATRKALDDYVHSHTVLQDKFVASYALPSLFDDTGTSYTPKCTVDWNSSKQVIPVLQALGFNTKTKDKKTKEEKDSAVENLIVNQKGIADDFLDVYFSYKEAFKQVTSYGQGHINQINPITDRIHTSFHQIGTVTGRMSSGNRAKNKDLAHYKGLPEDEVSYCNLQNLPARGEAGKIARACFTSTPGNVFISCDYSAEESRVSADVWNEQSLLDAFKHNIDTHNLYAKMCFPDELKDVDVKDVKAVRPDLRQAAKSAEFAVNYGSNGASIAANIGMSVEKAMSMVQGILDGMPGMVEYKKKAGKFLKEHGYIVINPVTGHRIYWPEWSTWKAEEDSYDRTFWENYKMYHKGTDDEVCRRVRKHMSMGHDWFEKNVLNYPIQGGSAIVLKVAAANLYKWVLQKGYFGKVLFCVFVHDELDVECPKELEAEVSQTLPEIMEKAAAKFYHKLKIPAEVSVNTYWEH